VLTRREAEMAKKPYKALNHLKKTLEVPEYSGVHLKYDTFFKKILIKIKGEDLDYRPIQDDDYSKISIMLENRYVKRLNRQNVINITRLVAKENKFNSVKELIFKTKIKQEHRTLAAMKDYLETFMLKGFGAEDTEHNRLYSLTMLLTSTKRIFKPGCQADWIFFLYGAQGIGKSRGLAAMCSPFPETYAQVSFNGNSNDFYRKSIGKQILENSETVGLAGKELEEIKALASKDHYEWVEKFQTETTRHYITHILVCTTNETAHLTDATGNRRMLFLDVGKTNQVNIEWLTSEALYRHKVAALYLRLNGWKLPYKEMNEAAKLTHHRYEATSTIEEAVSQYLNSIQNNKTELTILEILTYLIEKRIPLQNSDKKNRNEVGKALKKSGWENFIKRKNGKVVNVWQKNHKNSPFLVKN